MASDAAGLGIEDLRTFLLLAEHAEGARIAAALGVSASAVSRRLQELAGPPYGLIEKRGNSFVLTEKGNAVRRTVSGLLRGFDQLTGRLRNREALPEAVRIAAGGGFAATPLPRALAAFRAAHPDVGIRVVVCRGRERLLGVVRGEFELALVAHDEDRVRKVCREAAGLCVETLRQQPLVVAAAAVSADGKKLAACPSGRPVSPELLAGLDLLGMDPQSNVRHQLDRAFREAGVAVPPEAAVVPGGWAAALACARLAIGAAILPADLTDPAERELVVRPFLDGVRIADRVVWIADADNGRVTALIACLRSAFVPGG